jgi:hypothetical protein
MKHQFSIIVAILAGAFLLYAPAFGSQEDLTAPVRSDTGAAATGQLLSPGSWIRTWGEPGSCVVDQVVVDREGKMYLVGRFKGTVDFDPGPGVDEHASNGNLDSYIAKFDLSGNFLWARTWGGPESDNNPSIALDGVGGVYLGGNFRGSMDFDPGATVAQGVSNGETDLFLSKFDTEGNFKWVRTWGGDSYEFDGGVAADDSGNVYVGGVFKVTVDFDPGPAVTTASPEGRWLETCLSKFNSSGDFQWVRAWGGAFMGDMCYDVCVARDGNVYVAGNFSGTADFDPGDGIDQHTSNGLWDMFLSKFDSGGTFQWARTWGGLYDDFGGYIAVDNFGSVFVSGACSTIGRNFDAPGVGNGIDQPGSRGASHMSLARFDSSGDLWWAREWGGLGIQFCNDLVIDASGGIYVSENYQVVGGLDPESGGAYVAGNYASSVVKFDSMGRFLRYCALGDIYGTGSLHLAVDSSGSILIAGSVSEIGGFDKRLFSGDHAGSLNPGAFLIKLVE